MWLFFSYRNHKSIPRRRDHDFINIYSIQELKYTQKYAVNVFYMFSKKII